LTELLGKPQVARAGLTDAEALILCLYTGPMFNWYNMVLRVRLHEKTKSDGEPFVPPEMWDAYNAWQEHKEELIPFETTIHVLNSAVMKLSEVQEVYEEKDGRRVPKRVYVGLNKGVFSDQFRKPNIQKVCGGIDGGFRSMTLSKAVALEFAGVKKYGGEWKKKNKGSSMLLKPSCMGTAEEGQR
jgi:hypothetical protein